MTKDDHFMTQAKTVRNTEKERGTVKKLIMIAQMQDDYQAIIKKPLKYLERNKKGVSKQVENIYLKDKPGPNDLEERTDLKSVC